MIKSWCNIVCSELWITTTFSEYFFPVCLLSCQVWSLHAQHKVLSNFPGDGNVLAVALSQASLAHFLGMSFQREEVALSSSFRPMGSLLNPFAPK